MSKPTKIKNKNGSISYRIFVNTTINGKKNRLSKTFSNRQLAIDWADKEIITIQRASVHGDVSDYRISDIIERYQAQFSQNYGRSKNYDIEKLLRHDIAQLMLSELSAKHIVNHCIERNKHAKPQTVHNDVIWLRTILKTMAVIVGYDYPALAFDKAMPVLRQENLVAKSNKRNRRPSASELWALSRFFYQCGSKIPMLHIMWFAIFSTRRLSEITRIEWQDNNDKNLTGLVRDAKHPSHKKGNHKRFKYTRAAWRLMQRQPRTSNFIFPYNAKSIGGYFAKSCKLLGIDDLHFHDLRREGVSRLMKKGLTIPEVCLFSLHENWATLKIYTELKHDDVDI